MPISLCAPSAIASQLVRYNLRGRTFSNHAREKWAKRVSEVESNNIKTHLGTSFMEVKQVLIASVSHCCCQVGKTSYVDHNGAQGLGAGTAEGAESPTGEETFVARGEARPDLAHEHAK